jgi:hypothetical protein
LANLSARSSNRNSSLTALSQLKFNYAKKFELFKHQKGKLDDTSVQQILTKEMDAVTIERSKAKVELVKLPENIVSAEGSVLEWEQKSSVESDTRKVSGEEGHD